ncbi:Leucine-rich repeat receptor protein kinase [Quillaja saponaria]|uniref:Leucine-rich repeat receptor protein kinase n=1 Tax=Quillaja saponaria TaxID=32244 RepID=A0AAD7M4R4_QUISA|nr:Leucine-rich repeat receptor protein kinase [Quillaja saponaria]
MGRFSTIFAVLVALLLIQTVKYCDCENSTSSCIQEEGEALLKFKHSLRNISHGLSSWKGKDCCQWKGVFCDNTGHVVELDLRGNFSSYYKPVAPEILEENSWLLKLKYLTYLDLSNHNFQGMIIPNFLGSMKSLAYLNLSYANFSGEVPYHLGNLTALQVLDLHMYDYGRGDQLYVNDVNWISNLSSLHYLDVSGVQFGGTRNLMQVLNSLPSLTHLDLHECGLNYSHIPNHPVNSTHLATLQFLDLSNNYGFSGGPIPIALRNMTSLRVLHLTGNSFESSIPDWFGNFKSLVHLYLSQNQFNSTLDSLISIFGNTCQLKTLQLPLLFHSAYELVPMDYLIAKKFQGEFPGNLPGCFGLALETLDLTGHYIGGALPYWLGELKFLKYLYLGGNAFSGSIPTSLGKLSNLRELVIKNNQLNGTIPNCLGQLLNLRVLDVSFNSLQGTFSEVFLDNLSFLKELSISHNNLTAELKTNWIPPFQLEYIEMEAIKIGTQFPQWLQTQKQLIKLDLSDASIWGVIPNWILHMHLITHMNLSYNHITGPLPENIGSSMPSMVSLLLNNNLINGSIPSSLCNRAFAIFRFFKQ